MMLQEIAPHVYHNEYLPTEPKATDCALVFSEGKLAMAVTGEQAKFPTIGEVDCESWQYLFRIDDTAYFLAPFGTACPEGYEWRGVRGVDDLQPMHISFAAMTAASLARWYFGRQFCGACGVRMEHSKVERAMVCPDCGRIVYPTISPAVIVGVVDGDRLLLTRYAGRPFKRYALVAGYCEIGENVEDTVRREVMEEVGLKVKDLRFFTSQPWCVNDSLLMGFFCKLDGSDQVTLQEDELAEAVWFKREEISWDHSRLSLTGNMMEYFRENGPEAIWRDE